MADSSAIMVLDIHKKLGRAYLEKYPREAAKRLSNLRLEDLTLVLQEYSSELIAKVIRYLDTDLSIKIISNIEDQQLSEVFMKLDPTYGLTLLETLEEEELERVLRLFPKSLENEYRDLLSYPDESAAKIMDKRTLFFYLNDTAEEAINKIRESGDDKLIGIPIVDADKKLHGVVSLQQIALAKPGSLLETLISSAPISVHVTTPKEDVADIIEKNQLTGLPVVDTDGILQGMIRYESLVQTIQQEASDDLLTMFGAGRDEKALSKVSYAVKKRLPWLQINLVTAFLASAVVGMFEDTISKVTALAIFLPVVAGQSGNTGSQALAVSMRGLALREIRVRHWLQMLRKEVLVGFFNGIAVAATTSVVVYYWTGSIPIAGVIFVSMVLSMMIAGMSGALIPVILKSLGQDPALSSSIILTTVTDVAGFMSFLGFAKIAMTYFGLE